MTAHRTLAPLPPPPDIEGRPKNCALTQELSWLICTRCGLQVPASAAAPSCRPMTFRRMRNRMLDELASAEVSLRLVTELKAEGMPADPGPARARLSELDAIFRLIERCEGDPEILQHLTKKPKVEKE